MSLKKKFLDLKEQLSKHNNAYYNATTLISDLEYDRLKSKYEKFLQENPKFVELDDLGVGAKPNSKFKKIKHISRMLSLANSFNLDDLKDFFNKAENFLNKKISKNEFIVDCKIDGVSLSLTYQNNKLVKSLTRGDGIIGEDVTRNVSNIIGIPKKLKYCKSNLIEIRGEGRCRSLGAEVVLCLHDELLVHVPADAADDAAAMVDAAVGEAAHYWSPEPDVRFVADVAVVDRWSEAK